MVKNIHISDFDYALPDSRIARHPLAVRDSCKLLVSMQSGEISDDIFSSLPSLLPAESLLVCNDTRVINARIRFEKSTGSKIEVFLLEPLSPEDYVLMFQSRGTCRWNCMVGNLKRWKDHPLTKILTIDGRQVTLTAIRHEAREGNAHDIEFRWDDDSLTFASIIDAAGYIPIPPYLKRESEAVDADDYQTVYAKIKGSVAAPTAGLHFTPQVFESLRQRGIETLPVTLHVGAGTFQPVKSEEIGGHPMHTEVFSVDRRLIESLIDAMRSGRTITAVGTTSVRTLESLPYIGHRLLNGQPAEVSQWEAYADDKRFDMTKKDLLADTITALEGIVKHLDSKGENTLTAQTSIMIAPGFRWRLVDRMVTNFHQPQSTLLLLVSSFLGHDADGKPYWRTIYDHALAADYRFLSYGDACLFGRNTQS